MTFLGLRLPVLCLFFLGFPLFWLLWIGAYVFVPGPPAAEETIVVMIPARSGVADIAKILADRKVIGDEFRFAMLAYFTGRAKKLRAGEYGLAPGQRPLAIMDQLTRSRVLYRPVTIPEGTELEKVADILAAGGWVERNRFLELARDPNLLQEMGIPADSLEGYLFPDTYYLSRGQQDEAGIIRMMVAKHQQVYEGILASGAGNPSPLAHHEVVTLASIVEKETGKPEERGLVASVFLNRLQKNMRLQADPTVRYGIPSNTGPLTLSELQTPSPYNTYIINGLPPGPITNPGKAAIAAVLFPAATKYLFFVAKDNSSHHFSETLQEHNRAVARLRQQQ